MKRVPINFTSILFLMTASYAVTSPCQALARRKTSEGCPIRENELGHDLYVSLQGNDQWTGRLPEPNQEEQDGPFATLERARDEIRTMKREQGGRLEKPVRIFLREGTYFLEKPFELSPSDSGSEACPVSYEAFPGERPVLSAGVQIMGWKRGGRNEYAVHLPEVQEGDWVFRQLFVAQKQRKPYQRRNRPILGPFVIAGLSDSPVFESSMRHRQSQRDFLYEPGDMHGDWANREDVEVVALHDWSASRLRIEEMDVETCRVSFTGWPVYRIGHWYEKGRNPYFVENVKEAFGERGNWYLDRPSGMLRYTPVRGEKMKRSVAVAPRIEKLLLMTGDDSHAIEDIHFQGITFAHTAWGLPQKGYSSGQGMIGLPASVEAEHVRDCSFVDCVWAHLGAYALRLGQGCHGNRIEGCQLFDLGGGGVLIGVTDRKAEAPRLPTGNRIENCVISHGGLVHFSAHGIWVGIARDTKILHNVVGFFPYSAISVGWCWDDKPSSAGGTVIQNNHIHDAMMMLADGGGIYSLGWQPGNVIRGNHIHHVRRSVFAGRAPNNGIFFDQGSKGFRVEDNVFHSNAQAHIRYNQCKEAWQTWGTNYFFDALPEDSDMPEAAKRIVEEAGVEPEYKHLTDAPAVPPIPSLERELPPPPPPEPFVDDFESTDLGASPQGAAILQDEPDRGGRIRVSNDHALSGSQSLEFRDAEGLSRPFYPYLHYQPSFKEGKASMSLALRVEEGSNLVIEWRERAHEGTGPRIALQGNGTCEAGGTCFQIPVGQWFRLDVVCALGKKADGTFEIRLFEEGRRVGSWKKLPLAKPDFHVFEYLVITSNATMCTSFYLDNLELRPGE